MQSKATSVSEYLESLPADKRDVIQAVRQVILKNLPEGLEETMQYGMITYVVPLSRYPAGYLNKPEPLPCLALASQKNYYSLYLMSLYSDKKALAWFEDAYAASGQKLDMGKSCVRFKALEKLPLEVIGQAVKYLSVDDFIDLYEKSRQ